MIFLLITAGIALVAALIWQLAKERKIDGRRLAARFVIVWIVIMVAAGLLLVAGIVTTLNSLEGFNR